MASNGNFITTGYNDRCLKFEWELESQNIYTGVSTISWRLIGVGASSYNYYQTSNIKVVIDDTTVYSYAPQIALWEGTVAASGYYSFSQEFSGSKSFNVTVKAAIHTGEENCNGSGTWSLPDMTIGEPTNGTESTFELSATDITIGGTITANITSNSSSYTHDVEFYLSGYGGGTTSKYYTKYTGVVDSKSFTVPETWYDYMISTDTCTAYCKVTTKYGSSIVGSEVIKPFTVKILSSVAPTIGSLVLDPDDFTIGSSSYDYLVQGQNKLVLSVSDCVPTPGSKIESYTFTGPSINTTVTTTNDSATTSISSVASYGELTYKVTIKDSRGHKTTVQKNISCYNYQRPYFSFFNASRNGRTLTCTYTPLFSDINNKNTATVKIYANDILVYTDENVANNIKTSVDIILNSDKKHDVYAIITDTMGGSSSSKDTETYGSEKILNLASDGLGLAIGKMSTQDGLECSWDAQFYGDVNVSQSIDVDGDGDITGVLTVGRDIKAYDGISAFGDIMMYGNSVYNANSVHADIFYGNVDGTYVDVSKVMTQNVIMSGKLYQSTPQGNKLIYGITTSGDNPNLQVGSPGSTAYYNATMYAPGNIYLVPGGSQLNNDGWTVVVRNYVDENQELKRGVSVNGNVSCDGNMYINSKRVLTTEDLSESQDTPVINNGHYHSGKTLKCIGVNPKDTDGTTNIDTFTIDATTVAKKIIPKVHAKDENTGYILGEEGCQWNKLYVKYINLDGDLITKDTIGGKPTALYYNDKVRAQTTSIGTEFRSRVLPHETATSSDTGVSLGSSEVQWNTLYARKIVLDGTDITTLIGNGGNGNDLLSSNNTFTGINTFNTTVNVVGRINASSAIVPTSNSSYALGLSDYRWSTVYANNMNISGEVYNESGQRKYAYYSHTHDNLTSTAVFG